MIELPYLEDRFWERLMAPGLVLAGYDRGIRNWPDYHTKTHGVSDRWISLSLKIPRCPRDKNIAGLSPSRLPRLARTTIGYNSWEAQNVSLSIWTCYWFDARSLWLIISVYPSELLEPSPHWNYSPSSARLPWGSDLVRQLLSRARTEYIVSICLVKDFLTPLSCLWRPQNPLNASWHIAGYHSLPFHMNAPDNNGIVQKDLDPHEQSIVAELEEWLEANPQAQWNPVKDFKFIEQCPEENLRSILRRLAKVRSSIVVMGIQRSW